MKVNVQYHPWHFLCWSRKADRDADVLGKGIRTPVNGSQERAVRGFDSKDQGKSVNDEICKLGEKESSSREWDRCFPKWTWKWKRSWSRFLARMPSVGEWRPSGSIQFFLDVRQEHDRVRDTRCTTRAENTWHCL